MALGQFGMSALRISESAILGTFNCRTLTELTAKECLQRDLSENGVVACMLQETRIGEEIRGEPLTEERVVREGEEAMSPYLLYGGRAWKNRAGALQGGTGIALRRDLEDAVADCEVLEGVTWLKLRATMGKFIHLFSVHAPHDGYGENAKTGYYADLRKLYARAKIRHWDSVVVGGDLNCESKTYYAGGRASTSCMVARKQPTVN